MRNYSSILTLAKGYVALRVAVLGYHAGTLLATRATSLLAGAGTIKAVIGLARSVHSVKDAMLLLNMATKANTIGLIVGGIAAVASAVMLFSKRKKEGKEATLRADKADSQYLQTLAEEKTKISLLSDELKRAETPFARRKEIIEELRKIQPSLVEGITAESASYEQLAKNVEAYNAAKIKEVALESRKDELAALQKRAAGVFLRMQEEEDTYNRTNAWIESVGGYRNLSSQSRSNVDKILAPYHSFRRQYNSLEKEANDFSASIVDFANKFGVSLGGGSGTATVNPIIPGGDTTAENIAKGGTSQRVINITVHKFQDTVNNIFGGNNEEVRRKADEFMDYMNEGFLRILNSANQAA
jgi:hypothetical protein